MGRKVQAMMKSDQKRCTVMAGSEVEAFLTSDTPLVKEALTHIPGW